MTQFLQEKEIKQHHFVVINNSGIALSQPILLPQFSPERLELAAWVTNLRIETTKP